MLYRTRYWVNVIYFITLRYNWVHSRTPGRPLSTFPLTPPLPPLTIHTMSPPPPADPGPNPAHPDYSTRDPSYAMVKTQPNPSSSDEDTMNAIGAMAPVLGFNEMAKYAAPEDKPLYRLLREEAHKELRRMNSTRFSVEFGGEVVDLHKPDEENTCPPAK